MLKSYFTSAIRYLSRNRGYALLNTIGLSIGIACFTLIGLWVMGELSYDRFHANADRIYRVSGIFKSESDRTHQAVTPTPLRRALKQDLPEVEDAVIIDNNDAIVRRGDKEFMEDFLLMTEPSFLDIFSFQLLAGDSRTALNEPYSIILSKSMAERYFGSEDPIGKELIIYHQDPDGRGAPYTVTGIIQDCPENSHFTYQALMSWATYDQNNPADPQGYDWYNNGYFTYVLMQEGNDPAALEAKFPDFIEKYMGVHNKEWGIGFEYFLQPIVDIHLGSHIKYEFLPTSSMNNVIVFATIGFIVLLLACINYVNLATAFASRRSKEVGMRKLMGAFRQQLIVRYLSESCMLSGVSLLLAIAWVELSRPLFESLTGKHIDGLYTLQTFGVLLIITVVVGLLSGLYPAILLSAFRPIGIIKGQLQTGNASVVLRKSLVVVQYAITILLVVGIIVVQRQLSYMQEKDLGFNKDGLLTMSVNGSREVIENYADFANDLKAQPFVGGVARSNTTLAGGLGNSVAEVTDASGKIVNASVYRLRTDFEYLDVYQMKLLAGRYFQPDNAADSASSWVVNESFAKTHGYSDPVQLVGQPFRFQGRDGTIIGVVADFNYNSLQYKVDPTCLYLLRGGFSQVSVRLHGNLMEARDEVARIWKKHFPNTLVDARFAEESVNRQYESEQRFSKIFLIFSVISLGIACLGLFALVSFSMETRAKEIGIRKVLGASSGMILSMFSQEFLILIVVSACLAMPVSYYLMSEWLADFAYRIDLGPSVFVLAGLMVLVVAWLTISVRSIQAATANPIEVLRSE